MTRQAFTFIRPNEAELIKELLRTVNTEFKEVRFLEIGVFGGGTTYGIAQYCEAEKIPLVQYGVDIKPEFNPQPPPTPDYTFYAGDSMDMHREIKRRDFNFLFVDGCHCCNHAMADFLNYSPFVQKGGYCLFHDTAKHVNRELQEEWPQDHGYAGKPDSILGVREGLQKLGLLQDWRHDWKLVKEIPSDDGLMGMMLFKKLRNIDEK